jgi:hypothetical protein
MPSIVVTTVISVGVILLVLGLVVQRRAVTRFGTPEGKRAASLFRPRPSALVTRWFESDVGLDMYFHGQALSSIGLIAMIAGVAYAAGRGW